MVTHKSKDDIPKAKLSSENFKKSFRLFKYLGKSKWLFILGMFFIAGTASVGLYFPVAAGKMFGYLGNTGMDTSAFSSMVTGTGVELLILLVIQGFVSFGRVYTFSIVTENILKGLRTDTFNKLVQMPMSFFSKNQVADLSSRVATDINVISEAFTINIAEVIRQTIVGVGGIVLLVYFTSWDVAKWFIVIIPPITIIAIFYGRKIRGYSKALQDKISESSVIVSEALTGITSVKAFTNEQLEIGKYDRVTNDIRKFGIKYGVMRGAFFAFIILCVFGSIFFILYKMLLLINTGELTTENFGKFMMLSLFVAGSLGGLPEQLASIQRALGATDRVFEIIDDTNEHINLAHRNNLNLNRVKGELEFKNIQFTYPTRADFVVLKDVSFSAKAGETVALVGSSGSGKSTLASLALRFYEPNAGEYIIDGKKSTDYELTELRDQMAIVPQDVLLFGGTIRENILYGKPNATEAEVIEAAKQANAFDFVMSFPDKFETLVGDRGIQLSGGQRQRVAIARAVLKNPSILILDEATSSLDSESERLVQEALDKLMLGRTSIVIAHRLSTIRNADKIVVLQKGEVVEMGTHNELIKNENGLYHKLSKLQYELN
ncbi:MAG: ABC transporter ATP-binding protein/permease [Bacteroidia bacterium]|nr:ABC transporter ATP-binding protein/permease [Bacteroidia bacterium]